MVTVPADLVEQAEHAGLHPMLDFGASTEGKREAQLVHVSAGWRNALPDLAGQGRRWIVSPWVNSGKTDLTDLLALVRPGDRLIIRGRAEDFVKKISSVSALQQFADRRVDIKCISHLHAKVYVRELDGHGTVWLGSANLTRRGSDGDMRAHGNIEAMSGPHPLDARTLTWLEALWDYARPFNLEKLKAEIQKIQQDDQQLQAMMAQSAAGVLTLRVNFKLLQGQMSVPPEWLGMEKGNGVVFPAVKFIDTKQELSRLLTQSKDRLGKNLKKHTTPVNARSGLYVIRAARQYELQQLISAFLKDTQGKSKTLLEAQKHALRQDFVHRFREAVIGFSARLQHPEVDLQVIGEKAGKNFDRYIQNDPFGVTLEYSVPMPNLSDPFDPLTQAVLAEKARPETMLSAASSRTSPRKHVAEERDD